MLTPTTPIAMYSLNKQFLGNTTAVVELFWDVLNCNIKLFVAPMLEYPIILGADVSRQFRKFPSKLKVIPPGEDINLVSIDPDNLMTSPTIEERWFVQQSMNTKISPRDDLTGDKLGPLISNDRHQHVSKDISDFLNDLSEQYSENLLSKPPLLQPKDSVFHHKIRLKDPNVFPNLKPYRIPRDKLEALDQQLHQLLETKYIRPSASSCSSPCLFVPKADGSLRLVIDYRKLNSNTIADSFPLPQTEDLLESIGSCCYLSKLDLISGYHQIPMDPESVPLTAFVTPYGLFEWTVMPFGLRNAPATFQRAMNTIFQKALNRFIIIYLDDILVFSKTKDDHFKHLTYVFETLKENGFAAKISKCEFFRKQLRFLGHIIAPNQVRTDSDKLNVLKEWQLPITKKGFQSFVGFVSYYRKFVKNFAVIVRPLVLAGLGQLRPKDPTVQEAFEKVKSLLCNANFLLTPRSGACYVITTDASDFAIGVIIEILGKNGKIEGTVTHYSRSLNTHERHYSIREKELFALIRVLDRYKHWLLGHKIIVRTDHQSLSFLLNSHNPPNFKLARWLERLCQFDISIEYIKGHTNKADALSRRFELELAKSANKFEDELKIGLQKEDEKTVSNDLMTVAPVGIISNKNRVMVQSVTIFNNSHFVFDDDFFDKIRDGYRQDEECSTIYSVLTNNLPVPKEIKARIRHFYLIDKLLMFKGYDLQAEPIQRLWVPKSLQHQVITKHHAADSNLHPGAEVTFLELSQYYYWPKMLASVKTFVRSCAICQAIKPPNHNPYGLLQPLPIPKERWSSISMDFVGGFPESQGKDYILVVVDRLTKRAHFCPCSKTITARGAAELFASEIFKHHGLPAEIISDNDVRFTSTFWINFHKELQILLKFSTVAHPQTDGQTERTNRSLIQLLRAFVDYQDRDWLLKLPLVEFAYNSHVHKSTGLSPFQADIGFNPLPPHLDSRLVHHEAMRSIPGNQRTGEDFARMLQFTQELVQHNMLNAQKDAEQQYNKHRKELILKVQDQVLLHRNANLFVQSFKLTKQSNLFFGPYRISRVYPNNPNIYDVEVGISPNFGRTFNVKHIKPYHSGVLQFPKEPPLPTMPYLRLFAQTQSIKAVVGLNLLDQMIAFTFHECDPSHAVVFDIDVARQAIPPTYLDRLLSEFNAAVQSDTVTNSPNILTTPTTSSDPD
ncbi:hypothetical protein KGF57_003766 [Candida theae]|uniref:Uncharacterized protein n=1 Tax=Candida theae TaxID=1198502 RepID=A0AAD5BDB1_9ASCO|nr:uncharacterized protein KGF57_003766 [Candida theae]KAI5954743.1 hypothetical protein KGF57_003766 [Candida theae]